MRINLFAFGKLKTPGLRAAADYYLKLSKTYYPLEEIELKPLAVPDKALATRKQIQKKEAEIVQKQLSTPSSGRATGRSILYLLDEGGSALTTREWAELFLKAENEGTQNICFCIGSSLGFAEELRATAKGRILSLGSQTLPHELARVVLLEQIYRALSVTRGHPYHNE